MQHPVLICLVSIVLGASVVQAGDIPDAVVALDVLTPPAPGCLPEAAPARFVLLSDGTVYVGGTSELATTRLEKGEAKEIERLVSRVRKLSGLGSSVKLGPGEWRYRLALRKGPTILATGDPARAAANLRPLTQLIETLAAFDHPTLRSYRPTQYSLLVRAGSFAGGCRTWTFSFPPQDTLQGPRIVSPDAAVDWPKGAVAASVCARDKTMVVGLRPLIPGERP